MPTKRARRDLAPTTSGTREQQALRAFKERDRQRAREIDAANAERARHYARTPEYGWERVARERDEARARIAELEAENARLQRALARRVTTRPKTRARCRCFESVVLASIDAHEPRRPAEILPLVRETYGAFGRKRDSERRTLMAMLSELVRDGAVRRVEGGYVKETA